MKTTDIIHIRYCPHCGSKNISKDLKLMCCVACHIWFEHYPKLKAKADLHDELVEAISSFVKAKRSDGIPCWNANSATAFNELEQALAKVEGSK